jgi:hypothetical protein
VLTLCRFAYSDFVLARALDLRSFEGIPVILSYDCVCSYSVNIKARFKQHLSRHSSTISEMIFTIDSLHVHDHQDRCVYRYSTYYQECVGHFHGVQVEQFWSENNQIGPQTRQMNPGNRHDKITQSCADWNLKKETKTGESTVHSVCRSDMDLISSALRIALDLRTSWALYTEKRDFFRSISEVNRKMIPIWACLDRTPKMNAKGDVESVYRHSPSKGMCSCSNRSPDSPELICRTVLSIDAVLRRLLQKDHSLATASASTESSSVALFLAEGIDIKRMQ